MCGMKEWMTELAVLDKEQNHLQHNINYDTLS
jgi:hypothetical protein